MMRKLGITCAVGFIVCVLGCGPMIAIGMLSEVERRHEEARKERHHIFGTVTNVKTEAVVKPEEPEEKPGTMRISVDYSPNAATIVTFDDGREKLFSGVSDFEIPRGTRLDITYDGLGYIRDVRVAPAAKAVKP